MKEDSYTKSEIITIVLGVVLTIISFLLYFIANNLWINIVCGVLCLSQIIFQLFFQLANRDEFTKKEKILLPTILLTVFYGALLAIVTLINPLGKFCLDYIFWILYASSSLIPAIYILLLILCGLGSS